MVVYTRNPEQLEAEAGGFLGLASSPSTQPVSSVSMRDTVSKGKRKKKKKGKVIEDDI